MASGGGRAQRIDVGSVVAGRFRVHGLLGGGGMGFVYRAIDMQFDRPCALKILSGQLGRSPAFRARFEREAQLSQRTPHPHILPVFDSGADGSVYYIAMLLATDDLASLIASSPEGLDPARAVAVCGQIAWALDATHAAGMVHRDVKPANVLLVKDEDGRGGEHAYLGDFGIAIAEELVSLTASNVSSPLSAMYASPEQARGERMLDGRSDQYSLACTLYDALCGDPPFPQDTLVGILQAHIAERPAPPSERRPSLPPALDDVLARALSKDPAARYSNCREFTAAASAALVTEGHAPAVSEPDATRIDPPPADDAQPDLQHSHRVGREEVHAAGPAEVRPLSRPLGEHVSEPEAAHGAPPGADGNAPARRGGLGRRRGVAILAIVACLAAAGTVVALLASSTGKPKPKPHKVHNVLLDALHAANVSSDAAGLLPPSRCTARGSAVVTCARPVASVSLVKFETYPTLTALYDAYVATVRGLSSGKFQPNVGDCTRRITQGEVSWNHDYRHPRHFSLQQSQSGMLDPASQAAGRLFCTFDVQGVYHIVWTQDAGHLLGTLSGLPHDDAWNWWHGVHHAIGLTGSMQMSGSTGATGMTGMSSSAGSTG
jgi:serine/threonine protein kinase